MSDAHTIARTIGPPLPRWRSRALGWTTLPLGAFFEAGIARRLALPAEDMVRYVGLFGKPVAPGVPA